MLITIFFAALAAIALWVLWVRSRRKHVRIVLPPGATIQSLARSFAGLTWGHLTEGNGVRIVQNSAFFHALIVDVAAARHHVHLETFLWEDGAVSDIVAAALERKAAEGVAVRVLVDQRGAKQTSPRVWAGLRAAGCDFRVYHRARIRELAWYNNRDHRKIAIIDGRIGWTFGHGIADMWGDQGGWRDTAARFEGPVVNDLQAAFFDNWMAVTRTAPASDDYFPRLEAAGTTPVHIAYITQPETSSAVERLYYLAIAAAKKELILENPYFIPNRHAVALLREARARGVDVKLLLPTSDTSDFPIVQHASHWYYGPLLAAGARIWEFTRSGIHQKVMIVDREWCTIGSTNFDPRSFNINDEITVAIHDADVANELAAEFDRDRTGAFEWTLRYWEDRGTRHRIIDRLSAMLKRQL
ncbi:MAG TPA: phospholipase D-like domain-containing protein [Thermoanaerobaculia bacterium]